MRLYNIIFLNIKHEREEILAFTMLHILLEKVNYKKNNRTMYHIFWNIHTLAPIRKYNHDELIIFFHDSHFGYIKDGV